MKAYITSTGEPTTDLCVFSVERNGFEAVLIQDANTTLAQKLKQIYEQADDDFIRVDADVILNKALTSKTIEYHKNNDWWTQFKVWDWFQQQVANGGVQFIRKAALKALRANVDKFAESERPESQLFRLDEFHNPRRCGTSKWIVGIHGYKNDLEHVKIVKTRRKQLDNYDFELAERLNAL
jgi:hypothetical protein